MSPQILDRQKSMYSWERFLVEHLWTPIANDKVH